ncbi:hypothetical protein MAQ5080_03313 [Marinomonas aquimarina]|uniref:Uncharacterized protein TP-0789 domain-containing protein n=1 Tax=Marinomonas aquimarina TaxID=295068 RepID=A0A1A8TPT1_9GAMM|nr:outer membrane lipoprotein-sorting protein [Marinomonas aquimarina]SBS35929.1 hypothetical protein MAQ5080_03313 [Marinomonas aquimarina]
MSGVWWWVKSRALFALMVLLLVPSVTAAGLTVDDLVQHMDSLWRGKTSKAVMSMQVKTERYERTMSMASWSLGQDYSLVVIREPIKDKGIATLKVEQNIWNYLPKINRVTKVPASMMSGSWMGSHFTNDDLVKESSYAEDYESAISFTGLRDGTDVYEVTSVPRPDSAVVWGKIVMILRQQDLLPVEVRYFDEQEILVRTLTFADEKQLDGRLVPMRMTLQPVDKSDESTTILYEDIEFNVPIAPSFFSLQNLKRMR